MSLNELKSLSMISSKTAHDILNYSMSLLPIAVKLDRMSASSSVKCLGRLVSSILLRVFLCFCMKLRKSVMTIFLSCAFCGLSSICNHCSMLIPYLWSHYLMKLYMPYISPRPNSFFKIMSSSYSWHFPSMIRNIPVISCSLRNRIGF